MRRRLLDRHRPGLPALWPDAPQWRQPGRQAGAEPGLAAVPGSVGEYSWNGAYGTGFFADPKEKLLVVFGTAAPGDLRKYYREQVQDLVYGAMVKSRVTGPQ